MVKDSPKVSDAETFTSLSSCTFLLLAYSILLFLFFSPDIGCMNATHTAKMFSMHVHNN